MMRSRILGRVGFSLLVASIPVLYSCGSDKCGPDGEADLSRATPMLLLNHLAESFNHREIDWYEDCLAEEFVFELFPEDADSLGLASSEPWLNRQTDVGAVRRMFDDLCAKDINFTYVDIDKLICGGEDSTHMFRAQPDILVEIECTGDDALHYVINESYLEITVATDPANQDLWVIKKMTEIPMNPNAAASSNPSGSGPFTGTSPSRFGLVKSIYVKSPATRRTLDEALEDYAGSIEARDIDTYGDCLDYDHRFIFTDAIAECLRTPWWDKEEDLEAMANIFAHPYVTQLQFHYIVESRAGARAGGQTAVDVRIYPEIMLRYEAPGEEPKVYVVQEVFLDFRFRPRGSCFSTWTVESVEEVLINPMHERGQGETAGGASSWGSIKAMFKL